MALELAVTIIAEGAVSTVRRPTGGEEGTMRDLDPMPLSALSSATSVRAAPSRSHPEPEAGRWASVRLRDTARIRHRAAWGLQQSSHSSRRIHVSTGRLASPCCLLAAGLLVASIAGCSSKAGNQRPSAASSTSSPPTQAQSEQAIVSQWVAGERQITLSSKDPGGPEQSLLVNYLVDPQLTHLR